MTFAPLLASDSAAERAAPPAPRMTTGRPFTSTRFFRDASTPMPSVVEPRSVPSGCAATVFTLPQTAAVSSTSCMWARMSTLYGRVTLKPDRSRAGIAFMKPSRESACSGT